MSSPFGLFLFTTDPDFARRAVAAGVDGVVIDWEQVGKRDRQESVDTEVNGDTPDDLRRIRAAVDGRILCRINAVGDETSTELETAISAGADELLVPMVRAREEVEVVLELARRRVGVGILVETVEAVRRVRELASLPLARVFIGLNDLAIECGSRSIFSALADGTVDEIRAALSMPVGVAGMTLPEAGDPLPARLVIGELARLGCEFTFLRRSFRRDMAGRDLAIEIARMRHALLAATRRTPGEVEDDRVELVRRVRVLEGVGTVESVA